jgi:YggT family protein
MGYFNNALTFLISTFLGLYILAVLLRFLFQLFRADFHNPFSQFILKITTPALRPLRKIIPGMKGIDWPALVLLFILQLLLLVIIGLLQNHIPPIGNLIILTIASLIKLTIYVLIFALFISFILSWVAPGTYNYMTSILNSLTEPLLTPIRKKLPSTGGIDFSLLIALVLLQLLLMLVVHPLMDLGSGRLALSAMN